MRHRESSYSLWRIDPLHDFRVTPSRNPDLYAWRIAGRSRLVVVMKLRVIGPTVDDQRRQQFQIQPKVEPVFGRLVTNVMNGARFVQLCVHLTSTIAGNCQKKINSLNGFMMAIKSLNFEDVTT